MTEKFKGKHMRQVKLDTANNIMTVIKKISKIENFQIFVFIEIFHKMLFS